LLTLIIGGITGVGVLIISFMFTEASLNSLIVSAIVLLASFFSTLSVLVYLTGLNPGLLLLSGKTFIKYLLILAPIIIIFMLESFTYNQTLLLITSTILIPLSTWLLKKGINKITILD